MNTDHVDAYLKAMNDKDFAQIAQHLSENVVLLSPVFPEPFEGKEAVVKVLSGLLETIDSIQVNLRLASGSDVAFSFTIECDGITVIGNEFIRLGENGLIERFEVAWRPLASAVLIQEKLAEKLGGQPMRLVPGTAGSTLKAPGPVRRSSRSVAHGSYESDRALHRPVEAN
jgi:hypothetical protein